MEFLRDWWAAFVDLPWYWEAAVVWALCGGVGLIVDLCRNIKEDHEMEEEDLPIDTDPIGEQLLRYLLMIAFGPITLAVQFCTPD